MAGNVRFESNSASPEELSFTGSYLNGQRGNYLIANMDRSGSFREGSESRMFGSGANTPRSSASPAGDVAPLTHCLLLDPITIGDKKCNRSGELRRALGISPGKATEDNSFGAVHLKPPFPVATEELKQIKASVLDAASKARGRIKRLNGSLLKLNKYSDVLNLKKQQRNDMLTVERSGGSNSLRMGIQIRNPSDLGSQRLEDRTKSFVLNKRIRSSVAELRADGRSNPLMRQALVMGKDRDMLKDGGEGSDLAEEKVRRLPAGGEGWDKKMKRKRSVGTVFSRPADNDGEVKRVVHHKFNNESGLHSYDAQVCRSGSFNGAGGINKFDGNSSAASSNARATSKNDPGKLSFTRDFVPGMNKERFVAKANNKLNSLEDDQIVGPSTVTKLKASRALLTGSVMAAKSPPNFPRASGALDGWEQPPNTNKVNSVGGPNNRKRPMPTGSSSPPVAQWVGQRPQKISRTRRANVVSPVSNHDEVQILSEGVHSSDIAARVSSVGINGSVLAKEARVKHENVSSPSKLSETEESGTGEKHEDRPNEMGAGCDGEERSPNQNVISSILLPKKNKVPSKDEIGDGVRRQGRTGRGASSSRASISSMREKLGNPASTKPIRNTKPVSVKNGSKSGRPPLKKVIDRRAFTRLGQTPCGSPDFSGESDDDRDELLAAAGLASNTSYLSCSGAFWKKMEPVFGFACLEDLSYLKQELKSTEELHESLFEMLNHDNNNLVDLVCEEDCQSEPVSEGSLLDQVRPKRLKRTEDLVDQGGDSGTLCECSEGRNKVTPLYQRVLSALIVEDESEEFEENCEGRNISSQHNREGSPVDSCVLIDFEPRNRGGMEFDYGSMLGFQPQKQSFVDGLICNGSASINRASDYHNQLCGDDFFQGNNGFMRSKMGISGHFENNNGKLAVLTNAYNISALDCQYEQMRLEDRILMELQSVGIYPETVPDLADGEDQAINQNIVELQKSLHQQVVNKKEKLSKMIEPIEGVKETEGRALEQVAMDKLVELAYKKQLATRGSYASKFGVPKVSKPVALAFMRRVLARCRKFDDTGKSCFSEPTLRDVIFAPPRRNDAELASCLAVSTNMHPGSTNFQQDPGASGSFSCDQDFAKTGPISNRGKKKEVLLDDVGGDTSLRATSSLGHTMMGGAKGKRSERERDKDKLARNSLAKAGRVAQGNVKGDRKTKSKPKQKTVQLSTSGHGIINKFKETNSNKKRERENGGMPNPQDSPKESREIADIAGLQELDSVELGVANDFGDNEDLTNILNFDEVALPDNDLLDLHGLEIPTDDLSSVSMFV